MMLLVALSKQVLLFELLSLLPRSERAGYDLLVISIMSLLQKNLLTPLVIELTRHLHLLMTAVLHKHRIAAIRHDRIVICASRS